uniref:ERF family protein n=1 Tax=Pseudomonas phage Orimi01 TaxID=3138541 RepID=A0AAU6W268_9VIRU
MSNIIEHSGDSQLSAPVANQSGAMMDFIQRAASDPSVDIDKLERLIMLSERMQAKGAETAFNAAMAQMQCEIPTVGETGLNSHTRNAYATLDDINHTLKPIMQRHGFAVTFKVEHASNGISVTGILMHSAGHREQTTMLLPIDTGSGRNAVQAVGSSTTYGKRYVMCALLNITTGETRDDDGAGGGGSLNDQAVIDMLERVSECFTADDLTAVWKASVKVLQAAGDMAGYERVKSAVAERGKSLEAAQ